jgi:CheY-like chemotaxis protein
MSPTDNGAPTTTARRIFVVEDEFLIRMLLEDMLDDLGYSVAGAAARIDEAEAMAHTIECDVAVLDVNLDGTEVYPIAEILQRRGLPFVFVTGYGEHGLPDAYRDHPTLQKPFQIEDLGRTLAAMCSAA